MFETIKTPSILRPNVWSRSFGTLNSGDRRLPTMTKLLPSKKANNASSYRTLCKRASRLPDDLSENFIVREPETICDDRRRSAVVFLPRNDSLIRVYAFSNRSPSMFYNLTGRQGTRLCMCVCARVCMCVRAEVLNFIE